MLRRAMFWLGVLLLGAVSVLYLLGRGRVETPGPGLPRPGAPSANAHLELVRLHFGDPKGYGLVEEPRAVASDLGFESIAAACVRELASGSREGNLRVLPAEARLDHAFLDRWGVLYLDFDPSLLRGARPSDGEEWLAVGAVVRTFCANFPEVRAVRWMVGGEVVSTLGGYLDLEEPLTLADFPARRAD